MKKLIQRLTSKREQVYIITQDKYGQVTRKKLGNERGLDMSNKPMMWTPQGWITQDQHRDNIKRTIAEGREILRQAKKNKKTFDK